MAGVETLETLVVEEFGAYVGKHSQRLRVTVNGQTRSEIPLIALRQVMVKSRGVSVSSDAVMACAERGIPIHFVSGVGLSAGAALYTAALAGTVKTRQSHYLKLSGHAGYSWGDRRSGLAGGGVRHCQHHGHGYLRAHARNRVDESSGRDQP